MAINDYPILIDVTSGRLIRDINSDVEINPRPFVQGDIYNVKVMAVAPRPGRPIGRVYDFTTLPSTLYVALGDVGQRPESGTFTLTYGANTTSALAYNATPTAVQTALNALASITSAGGVSVSGEAGGPYQITFTNTGVRTAISATTGALYPLTQATIYEAREGTVSIASIQIVALDRQSAALAVTFTDLASASGTVTEIVAGNNVTGQLEMQRVTISADAYDGTFSLSFDDASTVALPYNIEAIDLQAALVAAGTWGAGVTVSGTFPIWDITFGGAAANKALATIDVSGLKVPIGKQGELALNTAGIEAIVAGAELATTKLEVSAVIDAKHSTILQVDAAVLNDGIQNAPETGPASPTYYTAAEVDNLLDDYVTEASLSSTLNDYVTETALATELSSYVSSAALASELAPFAPIYAIANADQDFYGGSGTAGPVSDDDTLEFSVDANCVYEVNIYLLISANATSGSGFANQWSLPSGAVAYGRWNRTYKNSTDIRIMPGDDMSGSGIVFESDETNALGIWNTCIIKTAGTAGTATLQGQSNFSDTLEFHTRKIGSYLTARKLNV
jgi:hypothetical protein